MIRIVPIVGLLVVSALMGRSQGQVVEVAKSWELDFAFHDPQRLMLDLPGQGTQQFWYVLYTVTNNTGKEVGYYPAASLVTNRLQVIEAGDHIHPRVYEEINKRHAKKYPFFAPPTKVTGPLLVGTSSARTSAFVFKPFSTEASQFSILIAGLSGDMERRPNPTFDPSAPLSEDNERFFLLRRTLSITYLLPGDPRTREDAAPVRKNREWVMR